MISRAPRTGFAYPYEEFAEHIKAMTFVREWEDTTIFGHLGRDQTNRAHAARVVEFFADSCPDRMDAVQRAEVFLSINDFIGRNADWFSRRDLIEQSEGGPLSVDSALLRAVHYVFTQTDAPAEISLKQVLNLARAFQDLEHFK